MVPVGVIGLHSGEEILVGLSLSSELKFQLQHHYI